MYTMKRFSVIIFSSISLLGYAAKVAPQFYGLAEDAVAIEAPASTGLDGIYVVPEASGASIAVANVSPDAKVYRFSSLGAAYAEEIASAPFRDGLKFDIETSDMGYIVEDGTDRTYWWVVNYANHELRLGSLAIAPEQECGRAILNFEGYAGEIPYYTINGRRTTLSRDLTVDYTTLVFDQESFSYGTQGTQTTLDYIGSILNIPAPLCPSTITLSGDRFMRAWGEEMSITSDLFNPIGVDAQSRATQTPRDVDNEQKNPGDDSLGGSAPCEVEFEAIVTDAAIFHEWQISRTPDFSQVDNTFPDLAFEYTFTDQGNTYVRFVANNAEGTCPFEGTVYTIAIGESKLEIPNAFSPQGSPGVNDLWKVSFKSIISYDCQIFNRWGQKVFSSTDPAQGWDGKYANKYVPSGVYFYVIKAVGADGVKYNKAGDINIINYTSPSTPSNEPVQ